MIATTAYGSWAGPSAPLAVVRASDDIATRVRALAAELGDADDRPTPPAG